jgi:hypothetical protein
MEFNPYFYRHSIYLVLAMTYLMMFPDMNLRKQWNQQRPVSPQPGVEGNGILARQVSNQDTVVLLHYP